MLDLSNDLKRKLSTYSPSQSVNLPKGKLLLYAGLKSAELLESHGYLNVVFEDYAGRSYALEKTIIDENKDTSTVVGIALTSDGDLLMGHWRGFESIFDPETLLFKSQRFTK